MFLRKFNVHQAVPTRWLAWGGGIQFFIVQKNALFFEPQMMRESKG
jgi:hypothetical protein